MESNFERVDLCNEEDLNFFKEHISNLRRPAILKGISVGPCVEKWTVQYLKDTLGSTLVQVHVTTQKQMDFLKRNFVYRTLPFDTFIERASSGKSHEDYFLEKDELYYLRSIGSNPRKDVADISKQFPSISGDLILPEDLFPRERFFSSVFRIGSAGTQIWTHYDVMDNFLMQIRGTKRVILYRPTDVKFMYLDGDKSRVLDVDNPDPVEFPEFFNAVPYKAVLEPGDILFIPALWFHNILNVDFSVGVNVFWRNEDPGLYDPKDIYGNRDLVPAVRAQYLVQRAVAELRKMPLDYGNFYLQRIIDRLRDNGLGNKGPKSKDPVKLDVG